MEATQPHSDAYYASCAEGLGALQAASIGGERFGENATARWKAFRGGLADSDRLRLLTADAAMTHPFAFAARQIFALPGLTDDESFGGSWHHPKSSAARPLLDHAARTAEAPFKLVSSLSVIRERWSLQRSAAASSFGNLTAASRLVVAGSDSIIALAEAMHGRSEMDFADQLTLVTDHPGERQLFGIAAALLRAPGNLSVLTPQEARTMTSESEGRGSFTGMAIDDACAEEVSAAANALANH